MQACDGRHSWPNQKWKLVGNTLQNQGYCLDVTNGNIADGTGLQLWTCSEDSPNQQWVFQGDEFLQFPNSTITLSDTNQCVDLTDGSINNSAQVSTNA